MLVPRRVVVDLLRAKGTILRHKALLRLTHRDAELANHKAKPVPNEGLCARRKHDNGVLALSMLVPRARRQVPHGPRQRGRVRHVPKSPVNPAVRPNDHPPQHDERAHAVDQGKVVKLRLWRPVGEQGTG